MNSAQTAAEVAATEAAEAAALAQSDDEEAEEAASSAGNLSRIHSSDLFDDVWGESTQPSTAAASSSSSSAAAAASGGFELKLPKLSPLHPPLSMSRGRSTGSEFDTLTFVARQELSPRVFQFQQESSRAGSPSLRDRLGSPLMMHLGHAGTGDFVTPIRSDRDSSLSSSSHLLNLQAPQSLSHSLASSSDTSALQSPPSHLSTPSWFQSPSRQHPLSSETTPSSVHSASLTSALKAIGTSFADSPAQFGTPSAVAAAAAAASGGLLLSPIHGASLVGASAAEGAEEPSSSN